LNSDPPLSSVGIALLLFDPSTDVTDAELQGLNASATTRSQEDLLKAATARLLTGSVAAPVNRAVEQTLGVNMQIAPSIGVAAGVPLTHNDRIIHGKLLSNRAFITSSTQ